MENFQALKKMQKSHPYKTDDPTFKAKVFELIIYNQLSKYIDTFVNKLLCGFEKAQCLLYVPPLSYMDVSKTSDCLSHDLIIAKFEDYRLRANVAQAYYWTT